MKKLTILTTLLTFLALGCNAQEPRPMYSVEYVDSLNNVISTLKENSLIIPNLINSDTLDIEISAPISPKIRIGNTNYGPYNLGEKLKLPLNAALFLLCKDVAQLTQTYKNNPILE